MKSGSGPWLPLLLGPALALALASCGRRPEREQRRDRAKPSASALLRASTPPSGSPLRSAAVGPAESSRPSGCRASSDCGPQRYCNFEPGLCGQGLRPGRCSPKPERCPESDEPVCGCDHRVYRNECSARAAGVDLDVNGGCADRLPDRAACGAHFCDTRRSYCEIVLSDVKELPSDFTCKPLPPGCQVKGAARPDCSCFPKGTRCLSFCGPIETGGGVQGLHLTCRL